MTAKEKCVLVDSLLKQEGRDAQGRFLKGRSGNPAGAFRKGRSGNPAGRRAGSRNKATETAELLLDGEAAALTRKAVQRALEGDGMALRLCLERIIPARRGRAVQLAVPPMRGTADLGSTMAAITTAAITTAAITTAAITTAAITTAAITTAAMQGVITPGEAGDLARVVEIYVRAVEATDFDRRLTQLEKSDGVGG